MNCEHCGAKMKDNDSVCPKCGKASSVTRIYLSCRACGATLTQDDDAKVFRCPYCGAKQLLEESENVKLARINADKEKEKAKAAWFSFQDKIKESRIKLSVDYETSFIKHWTVILICICNIVRHSFDTVKSISHGYSKTCFFKHFEVVVIIPYGHDL